MASDLEKITPPRDLTAQEKDVVFQYFYRRLASFRNTCDIYARRECDLSELAAETSEKRRDDIIGELNKWAKDLLQKAYIICEQPGDDEAGKQM
jgi:hypothetical protein